ncbi:MAG: carboxypeptidase-like regulatory domain-containing protein [Pirellulales bacterium]
MKRNSFSTLAAAVASCGLLLPPTAFAAQPGQPLLPQQPQPLFRTSDVALRQGGMLVGQVVNQAGAPQAGTVVSVRYADREVVQTTTDENGVFAAQGLRGGQYQLATKYGQSICRLWAADTAPPSAQQAALIVADENIVRGQFGYPGNGPVGDWVEWMKTHPYLTAGVVAAAIAIPIALSDDFSSGS